MGLPVVGNEIIAKGADGFIRDMGNAAKAQAGFIAGAASLEGAGKHFSALEEVATGAFRRIGEVAVNVAERAFGALLDFGKGSIGVAGDFEQGMNRFAAASGLATDKLGSFRDLFLKLGADPRFTISAAQAEEAAINLVKGGLSPAEIQAGVLADTLALAGAGELDLAKASDIVAKALGLWSSEGTTSAEVANLLSQAANASTVDVEGLALGLYNSQGVAKLAGVTFQDLVTALAEVSPGFSSAADAGTSMKTFLSRLIPTTSPAIEAMKKLGLFSKETGSAFYDAKGNFIGMEGASELLHKSLGGLTKAQQQTYLQAIFGQDAIRVAGLLAEKGAQGFDDMAGAMGQTGSAIDQAKSKQKGYNVALETLNGALETLQIVVGSAVLPLLTDLLNNTISPLVGGFTDFAGAVFKGGNFLGNLQAAVAATNPGLGHMIGLVSGIISNFQAGFAKGGVAGAVQKGLASLGFVFGELTKNIDFGAIAKGLATGIGGALAGAVTALATTAGIIGPPILRWIGGQIASVDWLGLAGSLVGFLGGALSTALGELGRIVGDITPKVAAWFQSVDWGGVANQVLGFLGGALGTVLGELGRIVGDITPKVTGWFQSVDWGGVASQVLGFLGRSLSSAIAGISKFVGDITPKISAWLSTVDWGTVAKAVGVGLAVALGGVIPVALAAAFTSAGSMGGLGPLQGVFDFITQRAIPGVQKAFSDLGAIWPMIWARIQPTFAAFGKAFEAILPQIQPLLTQFGAALQAIAPVGVLVLGAVNVLASGIAGALPGAFQVAAGVITFFLGIVKTLGDTVTGVVQIVVALFTGGLPAAFQTATQVGQQMAGDIAGAIGGLVSAVMGLVNGLVGGLVGLFEGLYHTIVGGSIIPDLANGVVGWFSSMVGLVTSTIAGWITNIGVQVTTIYSNFTTTVGNLWASVKTAFSDAVESLTETIAGWIDTITTQAGTLYTNITTKISEMWTSAKTTFSTSIDSLVSTVTNSVSQFTSAAGKIGQGLIDGVVKALNDGASSVTNTILSIIQSGIDAVKNFFGIHSPSEVAAREIGAPLVAGIVSGLLSGAGDVAAAMGQVVGAGLIPARAYATMTPQQIASTSYVNTTYGGNTYQLNVNAMQSSGSIVRDFGIMQVMSGK